MKRNFFLIITLCLTAVLILGAISKTADSNEKNISDSNNTAIGYKYTVKSFNGNVAVFGYGNSYPIEVLECPLKSLPDDEAQRLSAGIDIETEEELQQIIEAYD